MWFLFIYFYFNRERYNKSERQIFSCRLPVRFWDFFLRNQFFITSWINQNGRTDIMLFVTSKISSYYIDAPILLNSSCFLLLLWIFRGKMTNFCMINCCLTSSKRHARMAMFHCCYVFNLVMITPTILLLPSLMITSSIMLKLLDSIRLCALWWFTAVLFTFLNLLTL